MIILRNTFSLLFAAFLSTGSTYGALTDIVDGAPVDATVSWDGAYGAGVNLVGPVSYTGKASMFFVDVTDKDLVAAGNQASTVVQDYVMFCFDLSDGASSATFDHFAESAATLTAGDSILQIASGASAAGYIPTVERLFELYYHAPTKAGWAAATSTPDTDAAAFQIALWELAYDAPTITTSGYSWDLSSGVFQLGSGGDYASKTKAQAYLNNLTGNLTLDYGNRLIALIDGEDTIRNNGVQNMLGYLPIPEPSLLLIQGLLIVGFLIRRR